MTGFVASPAQPACAPRVDGKFLHVDGRRFLVRGVTYGTFAPDARGTQFPPAARIADDFARMAAAGINTVRVYTVPPPGLMDEAAKHGLKVMVGIPWAQHVAFLDDARQTRQIRIEAAQVVRRLASHPAALLFAVGNEIPAPILRWHGEERVERFLHALYDEVKNAAPEGLVTYVNFPPTEYLDLDGFDVCTFNVYLHRAADLGAYLARLQHIAGQKPLLLAEAGADSLREGLDGQAQLTAMQIRTAFAEGACGAVAFAWTDEWWRGGQAVEDWAFGLVDADRQPKPALSAVSQAFESAPFPPAERAAWPKVSVVVCAYNAADTIDDCLASLERLTYPSFDVIVVNDGSKDATGDIARKYPGVRVIDIPNGGLSAARNIGLAQATGDIVAYTDADVRVDPDWLTYLVQPMLRPGVAGAGGPNVVPPEDGWMAQCVARAPGSPTHVMLDDRAAEHVPGCNMAFRRDALLAINGFNPVYLRAGDDVDICWRLQAKGLRIEFAPSALVWHHHRASVKAYWRQQVGYGEGETWLGAHHPEKFVSGQMLWRGRIYSPLPFVRSLAGRRVNSGVWGTAAFPSVYAADVHPTEFLPHSPAWMVASLLLLLAGAFGLSGGLEGVWLLAAAGVLGAGTTFARCAMFARRSDLTGLPAIRDYSPGKSRLVYRLVIWWLHVIQPLARIRGRVRGLASAPQTVAPEHVTRLPWKMPSPSLADAFASRTLLIGGHTKRSFWSETWVSHTGLLTELVGVLRASQPTQLVDVGDGWHADRDLSLTIGRWGWLHVQTLIEEHAQGRCLLRVGTRVRPSFVGVVQTSIVLAVIGGTAALAFLLGVAPRVVAVVLAVALGVTALRAVRQIARTATVLNRALDRVTTDAGMMALPAATGRRVTAPAAPQPKSAGTQGAL